LGFWGFGEQYVTVFSSFSYVLLILQFYAFLEEGMQRYLVLPHRRQARCGLFYNGAEGMDTLWKAMEVKTKELIDQNPEFIGENIQELRDSSDAETQALYKKFSKKLPEIR
jgi:hypothetical protein